VDSPITSGIANIAGRGLGVLAALNSVKQGGLANYFMNRQRMLADPGFRATLAGSPFTAGVFEVGGHTGPAPALPQLPAAGGVAQPGDYNFLGPPAPGQQVAQPQLPTPTAQNVPGYMPGTARQWMPDLTPYEPKTALEQQGLATTEIGVTSSDPTQRAQFKMAGGIPLDQQEQDAAVRAAQHMQTLGGPGTVVQLDIPGMKTNVGSPYNFAAVTSEEYPNFGLAQAAAAARNANIPPGNPQWQVVPSGRGTFLLSPPASQAQTAAPAQPPTVAGADRSAAPAQPPATAPAAPRAPTPAPVARPVPTPPTQPGPYAGGYAYPATPPAQPPPPPPPPAPPTPSASPFDRDAIVPHTVIPERGTTGFPSAAFVDEATAPPPPSPAANVPIYPAPQGFVFHHSGGTTLQGLRATLQDRGLGSEYLMDRDGTIYAYGQPGSPHMQPNDRWGGIAPGLTNANALGMELVARNNQDVTPAQVASAQRFIAANYPNTPVYGHGEVNPGHKQADEGMAVVNAIRADRAAPVQLAAATPGTVAFPSPGFVDSGQLTVPEIAKPPVTAPPAPGPMQLPAPAAKGPTVLEGPQNYPPGQQMPMTGETRRTAEGEQTFHAPDASNADVRANLTYNGITNLDTATPDQVRAFWETQRRLDRQREMDKADLDRMQKAVLEGDGAGLTSLIEARKNVNRLMIDFPDPAVRAYYVGTLRYPMDTLRQMVAADPEIAKFHNDVAALGIPLEGSTLIGRMLGMPSASALLPGEQSALRSVLPTGATEPAQFEANLQTYRDTIDSSIDTRDFLRGRPVGATSVADINKHLSDFNDALLQRRLDAFQTTSPPAATPPTTTPPSTTPPTTAPPAVAAPWAPTATWTVQ
jgi:hypothetical protein